MAKDRTDSEGDDLTADSVSEQPPSSGENGEAARDSDEKSRRAARLAAIKKAVEAGDYDSDELLEIALKKMIQRLPPDRDDD